MFYARYCDWSVTVFILGYANTDVTSNKRIETIFYKLHLTILFV